MNEVNSKEDEDLKKHQHAVIDKIKKHLPSTNQPDILIIKAHLICEYYINQILILKEIFTLKEIGELNFHKKFEKAFNESMVFERNLKNKIRKLNKLRNKVGHELEFSLSESDVDEIGNLTGKNYIIKKYDFANYTDCLHDILVDIVIDTSIVLLTEVESEKKKVL